MAFARAVYFSADYSYYSSSRYKNYARKMKLVCPNWKFYDEFKNISFITVGPCLLYFRNSLDLRRYRFKGVICFGTLRLSLGRGVWVFLTWDKKSDKTILSSFLTNFSNFLSFSAAFFPLSYKLCNKSRLWERFASNFMLWVHKRTWAELHSSSSNREILISVGAILDRHKRTDLYSHFDHLFSRVM